MSVPVSDRSAADGYDDLIRAAWQEYQAEHGYLTKGAAPDTGVDFEAGYRAALESRPSLSAQSEEALRDGLMEHGETETPTADARALIESGVVRVVEVTAEQAYDETAQALAHDWYWHDGGRDQNPYVGNSRKEQGE